MKQIDIEKQSETKVNLEKYRGFVETMAKRQFGKVLSMEELVTAGMEGLKMADKAFNPESKFKFIAFAAWFVRQNILKAIAEKEQEENTK